MKIVIDNVENKGGTSFAMALYLAILYTGDNNFHKIFNDACTKGYVAYDKMQPIFGGTRAPINLRLTEAGIEYVESLMLDSEIVETTDNKDRYEILASKLRDLYPSGRKPGQSYMWKDSNKAIATRLKGLVKKFDASFTDEQAINATRKYIDSFCGDYKYMQLLKYFIMKKKEDTGEFESQLLSFIENEGQEDGIGDSWVNELR